MDTERRLGWSTQVQMLEEEIEELTRVIENDGYMSTGSTGQPVAHPALGARRAALALLHRLTADVPDTPEVDEVAEFLAEHGPAV